MISNVSGTLEEAIRTLARMSPEKWSGFFKEMFNYDYGNPVPCTEGEIPPKQKRVA